jgi:hypothetical protein
MTGVPLTALLDGYERAFQRWMSTARIDPDPHEAFIAIFDVLNWLVFDNRLREISKPWIA